MVERKSRASSLEARQSHAISECLTHNLLLLFEQYLRASEGLRDELKQKNQHGRSTAAAWACAATGILRAAGNFIHTALQRATRRTRRFIRRARVWIHPKAPWRDSIARLRQGRASTSAWFSAPVIGQAVTTATAPLRQTSFLIMSVELLFPSTR
jgi:hypothetical protein